MAARRKRSHMLAELERQTRDYFDVLEGEDNPHSHADYALAMLKSGETIASLARKLASGETTYSREMLRDYLLSLPSWPERSDAAKPIQALAMIEDAIAIVDERPTDKLAATWAMNRARVRESHARMINPDFQPNRGTNVQINNNIGMLHLMAVDPGRAVKPAHTHARVSLDANAAERLDSGAGS